MIKLSKLKALVVLCSIFGLFGCANPNNMTSSSSSIFDSSSFDEIKADKGGVNNPNDFLRGKTFTYANQNRKYVFNNDGTADVYQFDDGSKTYKHYGKVVYKIDDKEIITDFTHICGQEGFIGSNGELIEKNAYLHKYVDILKSSPDNSWNDAVSLYGVNDQYFYDYSLALMNTLISPLTRYSYRKTDTNEIFITEIPYEVESFPKDLIHIKEHSNINPKDWSHNILNNHDPYLGGDWTNNKFSVVNKETKEVLKGTWKKTGNGINQEFTFTVNGEDYLYEINKDIFKEGELVEEK